MITANMILAGAWVVISMLLGVIAYFLKSLLTKFDLMNETLQDVVLKAAVQSTACKLTHDGVTARLNAHAKEISEIKTDIKILKNEN